MSNLSRRDFIEAAISAAALSQMRLPPALAAAHAAPAFAYVGAGGDSDGMLHVFSVRGDRWSPIQSVPSRAPAFLLLSRSQRTLYVANDIELYQGLPRGTVEAFSVSPLDGRLSLLNRRELSLSATRPRHLAISPDARFLAVSAYGGGIYNLLLLEEDGRLGPLSSIIKETGSGPDAARQRSAHPHTTLFHQSGNYLLASDSGSDRLGIFKVDDGRLTRVSSRHVGEGAGPAAAVLHVDGSCMYVLHHLEGVLACYAFDPAAITLGAAMQRVPAAAFTAAEPCRYPLAMHPTGRMLYTIGALCGHLQAWAVHAGNGLLTAAQSLPLSDQPLTSITLTPAGDTLIIIAAGEISHVKTDRRTGALSGVIPAANLGQAHSVAIRTI